MSRQLRVVLSVCLGLVAALVVACTDDAAGGVECSSARPDKAANLKGTLTVGAVLPLTGTNGTLGEDLQRGIGLAVDEINADSGVLGKKLVVKFEDSEGAASSAVNAAKKLVEVDHVPVVIGEYSSGNTVPIGQYLDQQDIVHINPASSSPDIAKIGEFSFSVIGLDDVAGKFAADQIYEGGARRIALLGPNNAYGVGVLDAIEEAFEARGGEIVIQVLYTEGQSDYRQELDRIKATDADVLAYTAYGKEAQIINKEAFELGMDPNSFYGIYASQNVVDSDPEATNGQKGMEVNYIGPNGSAYQRAYNDCYGEDFKTSFSGYAYDAVKLAAQAIEKAGTTQPTAIRDALAAIGKRGFDGATGEIVLDADGQRTEQPYIRVEVVDGTVVPLD